MEGWAILESTLFQGSIGIADLTGSRKVHPLYINLKLQEAYSEVNEPECIYKISGTQKVKISILAS